MRDITATQIEALNRAANLFMTQHTEVDFDSERLVKVKGRPMYAFERVDQALSSLFSQGQRRKNVRTWQHLNEEWSRMRSQAMGSDE